MKNIKLVMLFCIGALFITDKSFGQANPFINVLPSNSGIVAVGDTIDIEVTIGNTGPISTIPQAKLRPIIQIPPSITFLPNAEQVGLPAGWTILSNSGSQLRICNSADPIPVSTSRIIILKALGVTVTGPQTFSGNINFGNGTTCAAGISVAGDLTTDNSATSTIQVVAPGATLNLHLFIEGYWDGVSAMLPVLFNQGQTNPITDCDSITVELRDENSPHGALYTTTAVLQTNGAATCIFPPGVTPGNYFIAIKHRNALQTWSAMPVAIGATGSYNFTTAATQAYGTGAQVQVAPGIWAMYSGDVVIDENLDLLDIASVEFDASSFLFGYYPTDLNGDGNVDLLDTPIVELNAGAFVFSQHP